MDRRVGVVTSDKARHVRELKELDELKKYYGTTITTRQALDALKEELRTQRERDPCWRFRQGHKFKTAWAEDVARRYVDRRTCR